MGSEKSIRPDKIGLKKRAIKTLDYDPDLTGAQLAQRFGITNGQAWWIKKEWKVLRGNN